MQPINHFLFHGILRESKERLEEMVGKDYGKAPQKMGEKISSTGREGDCSYRREREKLLLGREKRKAP